MTTRDPLEQFRRPQAAPEPAPRAGASGLQPYAAYKVFDRKQDRLDIRRVMGDSGMPKYAFLVDIRYNASFEDELTLIYTIYTVKIKGKNLRPVREAIADSRCDFIQVFHPNEHIPPGDPDAPMINFISFTIDEQQQAEGNK